MMPFKPSPRALVAVIISCICGVLLCAATIGFGVAQFVDQRRMSAIVLNAQAREDAHRLEIEKVRLEAAQEWQKKVDSASRDDAQQIQDIQELKAQNAVLMKSLDRLARSSEQRVIAAAKIQNKLDSVATKVEQVSDATPGIKKATGDINKKIEDANRRLK